MANTFGDVDLDMVKTDPCQSVPVVYGAQTGYGFDFTRGSQLTGLGFDSEAAIDETGVSLKSGDFTGLIQDAAITVDGVAYQIRHVAALDDAHVVRLTLADA